MLSQVCVYTCGERVVPCSELVERRCLQESYRRRGRGLERAFESGRDLGSYVEDTTSSDHAGRETSQELICRQPRTWNRGVGEV